ncbi:hypothetical protein SNE26_09220 [Mucilaginibacter sp. cycad4]|uniref:hypothetical protein n=1 Tax=Mucilaginibacter sp. cycad4 TaxID=3342096 RepID=UPI002AAA69E6|nr:hypothetical protein [Mucilaginibacter gossypii]WPV01953.1 hypothetical protein SNE26_09220 [Mucilaginibacter gossypii]
MATTSNFNDLAEVFTQKNSDFKLFETEYTTLGRKLKRAEIEDYINKFQQWLSIFTGLYSEISKEALIEDVAGHRAKYVNWLNVLINRIQFIYLTQLSYELSYSYNKHNLFVARVSIFIGLGLTIFSLAFPYMMPNQFESNVKEFQKNNKKQHERIIELENNVLKLQQELKNRLNNEGVYQSAVKPTQRTVPVRR